MKETPILFSTDMVKAILECRKTMTRRIVKNFSLEERENGNIDYSSKKASGFNCEKESLSETFIGIVDYCPYGKVGDVLWVKETFTCLDWWEDKSVLIMYEDSKTQLCYLTEDEWNKFMKWQDKESRKSSLFMFKSMSRICLEITDVKVERLQDISEEDAIREGIEVVEQGESYKDYLGTVDWYGSAVNSFKSLWQKINGEESWNLNPFVWVVSFKVLSKTGKPKFKKLENILV